MKKAYLFLFFICSFSYGQYEREIDSLYKIINTKQKAENKVEPYVELIEIYLESNPKKAEEALKQLYKLNKNGSCLKCEAMGDFYTATIYDIEGDRTKTLQYYELAAQKSLNIKDYELYQLSKFHKSIAYYNIDELENAEKEVKNFFNLTKKLNLKTGYEEMYYVRGLINNKKGFFNTAIQDLLAADNIINNSKLKKERLKGSIYNEIALTYLALNNYKKAKEYIKKSEEYSRMIKDIYSEKIAQITDGKIEVKFENYKNAITILEKANSYFSNLGDTGFSSICDFNLGIAHYHLNNYSTSIQYFEKSKNVAINSNSVDNYATSLIFLAKNHLKLNKNEEAKKNIDLAKSLMKNRTDFPLYPSILKTEIEYYKNINNYPKAFELITSKDSIEKIIAQKSNIKNLNELEAKYQTEKKEQQIKLLSTQNELAEKQKYIYIALLGLLALLGVSLFYAYRNKIKTAQKLNELNELKSRFFANISHEFRTPLTLIKSPVQSLQAEISNENQQSKLDLIDKNSNRMLELVDQLLELSKLDSGKLKLILKEGNIGLFLHSIVESFTFQAKENKLLFTSTIEKNKENHHFDKDVIEKIVTNLLSNAIKYTPENEKIDFSSTIADNQLRLVVSNSCSTLKKEEVSKLFERFYQKNETQQGVGIGLALVKELVDLYKGTIATTLENGQLSFMVNVPLTEAHENAVSMPTKETTPKSENIIIDSELPVLLIVDDNAEIRSILKDIFKENYQILEAEDGEQALKIAKKEIPDCIISDVMMPKMDGFEFTKTLKSNELTSFIPVILLTAKTSDEAHLEGLKSTADAFLTKPFNNEIVKETVIQLIAERKKLHTRYSQELVLRPVDIVINSVEEKFIEKLQLILSKELANADFSADDFANSIGMSRMQLHRKLKSLLGVSATEFLRNERLKASTELLKKGKANISEIAYSVGFNDVSYFSKCFKEMYHCTPTEYMEKN